MSVGDTPVVAESWLEGSSPAHSLSSFLTLTFHVPPVSDSRAAVSSFSAFFQRVPSRFPSLVGGEKLTLDSPQAPSPATWGTRRPWSR